MSKLPEFLKKYFWDVDFENIEMENRRVYILKRILEYGDEKAVSWMRGNFTKEEIKDVLIKSRGFSQKSANFWAFVLDIEREKVKCLNKSFQKTQNQFWHY